MGGSEEEQKELSQKDEPIPEDDPQPVENPLCALCNLPHPENYGLPCCGQIVCPDCVGKVVSEDGHCVLCHQDVRKAQEEQQMMQIPTYAAVADFHPEEPEWLHLNHGEIMIVLQADEQERVICRTLDGREGFVPVSLLTEAGPLGQFVKRQDGEGFQLRRGRRGGQHRSESGGRSSGESGSFSESGSGPFSSSGEQSSEEGEEGGQSEEEVGPDGAPIIHDDDELGQGHLQEGTAADLIEKLERERPQHDGMSTITMPSEDGAPGSNMRYMPSVHSIGASEHSQKVTLSPPPSIHSEATGISMHSAGSHPSVSLPSLSEDGNEDVVSKHEEGRPGSPSAITNAGSQAGVSLTLSQSTLDGVSTAPSLGGYGALPTAPSVVSSLSYQPSLASQATNLSQSSTASGQSLTPSQISVQSATPNQSASSLISSHQANLQKQKTEHQRIENELQMLQRQHVEQQRSSQSYQNAIDAVSRTVSYQQNFPELVDGYLPRTTTLFVWGFDRDTDEYPVHDLFQMVGEVVLCDVFREKSGRSRGCALVGMDTFKAAHRAIGSLDGCMVEGWGNGDVRTIHVKESPPQKKRGPAVVQPYKNPLPLQTIEDLQIAVQLIDQNAQLYDGEPGREKEMAIGALLYATSSIIEQVTFRPHPTSTLLPNNKSVKKAVKYFRLLNEKTDLPILNQPLIMRSLVELIRDGRTENIQNEAARACSSILCRYKLNGAKMMIGAGLVEILTTIIFRRGSNELTKRCLITLVTLLSVVPPTSGSTYEYLEEEMKEAGSPEILLALQNHIKGVVTLKDVKPYRIGEEEAEEEEKEKKEKKKKKRDRDEEEEDEKKDKKKKKKDKEEEEEEEKGKKKNKKKRDKDEDEGEKKKDSKKKKDADKEKEDGEEAEKKKDRKKHTKDGEDGEKKESRKKKKEKEGEEEGEDKEEGGEGGEKKREKKKKKDKEGEEEKVEGEEGEKKKHREHGKHKDKEKDGEEGEKKEKKERKKKDDGEEGEKKEKKERKKKNDGETKEEEGEKKEKKERKKKDDGEEKKKEKKKDDAEEEGEKKEKREKKKRDDSEHKDERKERKKKDEGEEGEKKEKKERKKRDDSEHKEERKERKKKDEGDEKEEKKERKKRDDSEHKEERKERKKRDDSEHKEEKKERKKRDDSEHKEEKKEHKHRHREEEKPAEQLQMANEMMFDEGTYLETMDETRLDGED
ncbi:hypothetical protein BLNAU_473 [Blattamonas nauphoetae]|uniref:RRM domain-containing protein n=1 Tax=Blattamonas nauphoetae TaxID=2049346 RepID=A0ABQ9YLD3_9EUKA|nr:hypothetical protein BLNAU_473 [Blattamonas nauphoetae]